MADSNFKETCNSCKFFSSTEIIGLCKRYPDSKNKHSNDWCGEFIRNKSAQVIDSVVISLVKDELPISVPLKKKAGRPRKAVNES